MKIIGLTGGIGSGKSTVAGFLAELGAACIDLDKVGHEVLKSETGAWRQAVVAFGKGILDADGEIDRVKLSDIVFKDPRALVRLNSITHPAIDAIIAKRIKSYLSKGVKVVVLEAAAMIDAGKTLMVEELWVTVAPQDVILKRLKERSGYSQAEAKKRIGAQLSDGERIKDADVVIDTDCSLDELKARVNLEWQKLLKRL
jgi:dephospho-CoA kinase